MGRSAGSGRIGLLGMGRLGCLGSVIWLRRRVLSSCIDNITFHV
jgi:hypothetical protein